MRGRSRGWIVGLRGDNEVPCSDRIEALFSGARYSMKLQIVLEPSDEGGFTATVPALPGCISEGNTREEALRNIEEAIRLYLEPVDDAHYGPNAEILEIAM